MFISVKSMQCDNDSMTIQFDNPCIANYIVQAAKGNNRCNFELTQVDTFNTLTYQMRNW